MTEDGTRSGKDSNIVEVLVGDPLTQVTRKERVYLLGVSLIGIAIVKTGLVPSRIATLGIQLDRPDRQALLGLLAVVTFYFLIAFVVYAASDYVTRREVLGLIKKRVREAQDGGQEQSAQESLDDYAAREETKLYGGIDRPTTDRPTRPASEQPRRVLKLPRPKSNGSDPLQTIAGVIYLAFSPLFNAVEKAATAGFVVIDRAFAPAIQRTARILVSAMDPLTSALVLRDLSTLRELTKDEELYQLGASTSSRVVAALRLLFEFLLPILVGIYAVYTLLMGSFNPPGSA